MKLPLNLPKTKIIGTIGPASWDQAILEQMVQCGMSVARINASFADEDEIKRVFYQIRDLSPDVSVMIDTKGHKIRLSDITEEIILQNGQQFSLFTSPVENGVFLVTENTEALSGQIPKGANVLIDDGALRLRVLDVRSGELVCTVEQGGRLGTRKSVLFPGVSIDFGTLSKKDYEDILLARELGFDFVAASFICSSKDVESVRELVGNSGMKIISKIESEEGVSNFDAILEVSDGIMIARGDLGVGLPSEKVPMLQKEFIQKCNEVGKPVIVATQMLQSMTQSPTPTRAEVNDVANAILDGADAIMLSAETSVGKFPVEAVETMGRVAREIEKIVEPHERDSSPDAKPATNAISQAVFDCCRTLPIEKILVATASGTTARTVARFRPSQMIYAFTRDDKSKRSLGLSRGIIADVMDEPSSTRDTGVKSLVRTARNKGHVSDTDLVIVVAGANIMGQGETNMLEINRVEQIIS